MIKIPTMLPSQLSAPTLKVYRRALADGGTIQRFEDTATIDAAREIDQSGLGRYREPSYDGGGHYLWVSRLSKHYTLADGGRTHASYFDGEITLLDSSAPDPQYGALLATVRGAALDRRDPRGRSTWPTWQLRVRHATATDFEHDSSTVAEYTLGNPVFDQVAGNVIELTAVLQQARQYPWGVDPLSVDDPDTAAGMCDGGEYCKVGQAHPYAPYLPPERAEIAALNGHLVHVQLVPAALRTAPSDA